jgi:hypothetical protein
MKSDVAVLLATLLLVWMIISVGLMTYLARRYIDVIESSLSRCSYVQDNRSNFSSVGLIGKVLRTCLAANMLMIPKIFVVKGVADASEILHFPKRIKNKLLVSWGGLVLSTSLFFAFNGMMRFFGWSL